MKLFSDNRHFPIFHFILRVLADYLGEPEYALSAEVAAEPVLTSLFNVWRDPDPAVLLPLCVAACDFHTTRNRYGDSSSFYEFERDMWAHYPVELLMVFRLREYLQMENPKVDHPLMNSALGVLPAEGSCEISDPVLQRTLERMRADGYDEDRIVNEIVGDAPRKGGDDLQGRAPAVPALKPAHQPDISALVEQSEAGGARF